ncbi:MAG: FAD-dependent thymidylate synthase [Parabacteroides sp.]|nr:FAD-dependent thymidylate synthase [Parabacteroides sp.]
MRLVKQSYEIWEQSTGETQNEILNAVYKQIERAARVCYKSELNTTEDSAMTMVDKLIKSGHMAMLEHGTVYLDIKLDGDGFEMIDKYIDNKYSYATIFNQNAYITTNMRVLVENGWMDDVQYICNPTEYHEKRICVKFICDRGVSHEFVRHRVFSFAQESTRFCNYSKDKFGHQLTFIIPLWCKNIQETDSYDFNELNSNRVSVMPSEQALLVGYDQLEKLYFELIDMGWKPQQARTILPTGIKTELVMTGTMTDWEHFFDLRSRGTTGAPHPQAKELAEPLEQEFKLKYHDICD